MHKRDWGKRFRSFILRLKSKLNELDRYKTIGIIIQILGLLIQIFKK